MIGVEVLPNIPRLYTALAEWLACMICLLAVRRRLNGFKFYITAALVFVLQASFLTLTSDLRNLLWILCMIGAVVLMYAFVAGCADLGWRDAAYYTIRAFVLAEFAASLEWQVYCYLMRQNICTGRLADSLTLLILYAVVFSTYVKMYHRNQPKDGVLNITNRELVSYTIIGIAIFFMSNLGFVSTETLFGGSYAGEIYNVRTLIDLGGVAIMYAYHVQRVELRTRYELESVQNILHNQYVQYKQAREAMDLVNYKYHDLKHHILALRAEENTEKRNEYLDQMEDELQDYEAQNKTGNKIIDVMLTMKDLYCKKHGITMTCVVDGTPFEFMNAMDISSIFGNALDNAIECELKIADKEKRLIHVSAYTQKNLLIIGFENYYEGDFQLGEDFPTTTKKDARFHGYGLKSLQYTVQKYNGAVDVSTQDQWFHLKILIPM